MRIKKSVSSLLLVFMAISAVFSAACGEYYKKPNLQEKCEIDLGEDKVTDVKEYGRDGFLCLINGNEIRLMASSGKVLDALSFEDEVTLLATDDEHADGRYQTYPQFNGGNIVVVCGEKTVRILSFDEGQSKLFERTEFSCEKTVISASVQDDYVYILSDNGDLYGVDVHAFMNEAPNGEKQEEKTLPHPKLILQNVKLVGRKFVVLNDNSYMSTHKDNLGNPFPPFDEEIIGVVNMRGWGQIITSSAMYEPIIKTDIKKLQTLENGEVYAGRWGYFDVMEGKFYYTGLVDGREAGPNPPETKRARVDIPTGYKYCCICRGIVCYDEHKIICYYV